MTVGISEQPLNWPVNVELDPTHALSVRKLLPSLTSPATGTEMSRISGEEVTSVLSPAKFSAVTRTKYGVPDCGQKRKDWVQPKANQQIHVCYSGTPLIRSPWWLVAFSLHARIFGEGSIIAHLHFCHRQNIWCYCLYVCMLCVCVCVCERITLMIVILMMRADKRMSKHSH